MGRRRTKEQSFSFVCHLCGKEFSQEKQTTVVCCLRPCKACGKGHRFCPPCDRRANDLAMHGQACPVVAAVLEKIENPRTS